MPLLLIAVLLMLTLSGSVMATSLEELLNRERYAEFLPLAEKGVAAGDQEALFLLGKAYHLGLGVDVNEQRATDYYQQARALGSARASHNLGSMLDFATHKDEAIAMLEEALERGLKMPTLINLANAHTPKDEDFRSGFRAAVRGTSKAGDYFAMAYEHDPQPRYLSNASHQYLRGYLAALDYPFGRYDRGELDQLRSKALEWLEKGMALDDKVVWTNYGIMLYSERNYTAAREALMKGVEGDVAVAHYYLGRMASAGQGLPGQDRRLALLHYDQAAMLGMQEAIDPTVDALQETLRYEKDLDRLGEGVRRLTELQDASYSAAYALEPLQRRLTWGVYLQQQREQATALPDKPLHLRACGLHLNQPYGSAYNLGFNTSWRLVAYRDLGSPERFAIEGRVDEAGCAALPGALPDTIRRHMDNGAVLALSFPNYTLPLSVSDIDTHLVLDMQAFDLPRP
ncbi:MAG: sel1 repeat family protein [Gammaproteobacteria bacterium HGW-Gammaproteobacteria-6]|nr:MAG: sel1 repeat family protein [Gammaproteobacteria bacterium HGW-Gammaproteobacteria-6]